MSKYDGIYRRFFSHPEMILDLLRRFVGGDWIANIDAESLKMLPAHYVAEELEHREQDLVWRIRYDEDRNFYLYLLLEFQSSVDRFMALRLLVYLGLLYQDLVKQNDLTPDGRLPPVLPLVLYNGEDSWWAATQLSDLIESGIPGLGPYQPRFRYQVVDEVHLPEESLASVDSPVAGMFRVERSRDPGELRTSLRSFLQALEDSDLAKLAPDVETWLRRVIGPKRFHDLNLKSWDELREVTTMLEERMKLWEDQVRAEERAQGLAEGHAEGHIQGRTEGRTEGRAEGRIEGLQAVFRKQFLLKFRRDLTDAESRRLAEAGIQELEYLLVRILSAENPESLSNTY